MRASPRLLALGLCLALACVSCGDSRTDDGAQTIVPSPIADQECEVCGMLVRDQSAPRGQVVHRDGTEAFACSLGDLLVHLSAPSPHGRASEVFVEVMHPDEDPAQAQTHTHRWIDGDDAWFVVGVERNGIMGPPILAYETREAADQRARRHASSRVLDLAGLRDWWSERLR